MRELAHHNPSMFIRHTPERDQVKAIQKLQYGGLKAGAVFFGWLTAHALIVLFMSLLSALLSTMALSTASATSGLLASPQVVSLGGAVLLLLLLATAYYTGGYVAGRMSRFDGAKQGLGVWVMGMIITAAIGLAGAVLGANLNVLQRIHLPHVPIAGQSFATFSLLVALAAIALTIIAAISGGKMGQYYHKKVDRAAFMDIDS